MSIVTTFHLTIVSHRFPTAKMGKLRAKRRAAERRNLDGQESDFDDRATTSEIAGRDSTISTSSRSATSITASDDDSDKNNSNISNDDNETLAVSVEALTVADPAQRLTKNTDKESVPAVPRSLPSPPPSPMAVARAVPLLICSVGNPGSTYANTLHSAGHTVLKKLSERLEFQPYQKSRPLGSGLVSRGVARPEPFWCGECVISGEMCEESECI